MIITERENIDKRHELLLQPVGSHGDPSYLIHQNLKNNN